MIRRSPTRDSPSASPAAAVAIAEGTAKTFACVSNSRPRSQSSFGNHATVPSRSAKRSRQINNLCAGTQRRSHVRVREFLRPRKENAPGFVETAFFDRLYHRRFACGLRQYSRRYRFIHQRNVSACKAPFAQKRSQFRAQH